MQSKLSKFALAAAAGALLTVGVAGTATAADTAWGSGTTKGRVTANGGLLVRSRPNTSSRVLGSNAQGSIVTITCKVTGENVRGNNLWYLLDGRLKGYSSARYIDNVGRAPEWCRS